MDSTDVDTVDRLVYRNPVLECLFPFQATLEAPIDASPSPVPIPGQ